MQLGIIGMPMVGKSTIFDLMTENRGNRNQGGAKTNTAIARIPDNRIDYLSELFKPKKTTYAQLEVVDIPGLVPGGEKSASLFLDSVRRADALLMVVRVFDDANVPLMSDKIDPVTDIETILYELLLADLDLIEKRIDRIEANKKKNQMLNELNLLKRMQNAVENEQQISSVELNEEESEIVKNYQLLTVKPLLVCLNVSEDQLVNGYAGKEEVLNYSQEHNIPVLEISAEIEKEIQELEPDEREIFMNEIGIEQPGIVKISRSMYQRLGLISFFTVGEDEVKAWTIEKGTNAKKAAGKIHSDIERGFIRAEVVDYQDLNEMGSMNGVKEKGLFRLEGKEYIVKDGDIVHFRFNV
ncbi:redox-regulated ATPase YchF [Syntrophomonas erecta]